MLDDAFDNPYYKDNPRLFNQLVMLVEENPRSYFNMLRRDGWSIRRGRKTYTKEHDRSEIMDWMNRMLPKLDSPEYSIATKCHWIINGLVDFPICSHCGKSEGYVGKNVVNCKVGYHKYCSVSCMASSDEVSATKFATCKERYGTGFYMESDDFHEKSNASMKERYGGRFQNADKARCTRMTKYGKWESDETAEKRKNTNLGKYGAENVFAAESVKDTIRGTCFEHYGVEYCQQCPDVNAKTISTKISRYGSATVKAVYSYDCKMFDSMPEMAVYVWLIDSGMQFEFHPRFSFKYEFEGREHLYFPDFLVGNAFYEVKGDMFFEDNDPSKRMICRWNRELDGLYEAKHQCMLVNGVMILTSADYLKYVKHCEEKFGSKTWYRRYRTYDSKLFRKSGNNGETDA